MILLDSPNDRFTSAKRRLETHKITTLVDPQNDISCSRKTHILKAINWRVTQQDDTFRATKLRNYSCKMISLDLKKDIIRPTK